MATDTFINCFTVFQMHPRREGVPLGDTIPLTVIHRDPMVYLGEHCMVPLDVEPDAPLRRGHLLYRARVVRDPFPRLEKAGPDANSILVRVVCRNLRFDFDPLAEDLNLWPGGDGDIWPVAQFGDHKDAVSKQQLFEVPDGAFIYLVDQKAALARLNCVGGQPVISRPDIPELIQFLVTRAKDQKKVWALDWAWHNLRALDAHGAETGLIDNAIDEVNRLRANA